MVLRKSCGDAFIVGGYGVRWKMCEGRVGDSWGLRWKGGKPPGFGNAGEGEG